MATSLFQIREACKSDIPALVHITLNAHRGRPLIEALFPPQLKSSPDDKTGAAFYEACYERGLKKRNRYYPVVVNEADEILGFACWHSAPDPPEPGKTREERKAEAPPSLDFNLWENVMAIVNKLQENVKDALGEAEFKRAWYLDTLAVDPAHQRKGVARLLMQWGEECAAKEHKSIHLVASPTGAKLYSILGYEQVGEIDLLGEPETVFIKKIAAKA